MFDNDKLVKPEHMRAHLDQYLDKVLQGRQPDDFFIYLHVDDLNAVHLHGSGQAFRNMIETCMGDDEMRDMIVDAVFKVMLDGLMADMTSHVKGGEN